MAYIPPHKRHTRDTDKPDPKPALLAPQFRKNLSLGSSSSSFNRKNDRDKPMGWNIKYPNSAVFRWFAVGLTNDDVLPFPVSLQLVPSGIVKSKDGERLILVNTEVEKTTEVGSTLKSPWVIIAENVLPDLLSSFLAVRNENENNDFGKALVARIGKIMFHRTSSVNIETGDNNALPLSTLRNLKKTFYTNLPSSYLENITTGVAQEVGLEVEDEKERYLIQLYDKEQPDATIFCKCKVTPDGRRLELLKPGFCDQIQLAVRYAAIDIACLTKKLDLRLDLYTMTDRNITTFNDVEKHSLQDLVNSAVLDSNIKGGLRWSLGKDCSGERRYRVVGVWHTKTQYFKNSNLRLKMRSADRYDFRTSTGEFSWEVILQLCGMFSKMKESNVENGSLLEALADRIKVIWNHFLHCDNYLSIDSTISS
ncbi:unnamed protein product [Rhodiola kirilowii]